MKNAREHIARKGVMLQQFLRGAPGIKRLRGRPPNAPAPSSVMPERGRPGNALGAVLSLALLLCALLGLLAAITGAYALTPKQLSASSLAGRPTKRLHPGALQHPRQSLRLLLPPRLLRLLRRRSWRPPRRERLYQQASHLLLKRQRHQSVGSLVAVQGQHQSQHRQPVPPAARQCNKRRGMLFSLS